MGEASRVYRANPRKAGSAYTGHSRGTYAIWHSICEWIRCLATQTTAIGFHLMNRGPERERESLPKHFCGVGTAQIATLPPPPQPSFSTRFLQLAASMTLLNAGPPNCAHAQSKRDIARLVLHSSVPRFSFSRTRSSNLLTYLLELSRPRLGGRRKGERRRSSGKNRSLKISRLRREGGGEGQSS